MTCNNNKGQGEQHFEIFLFMVLCFSYPAQVYGMSESTGPHSINNITKGYQLNSAGKSVPGCLTKIANPDKDGNGEVILKNIFFLNIKF
jgi:hypothetical protein